MIIYARRLFLKRTGKVNRDEEDCMASDTIPVL